MESKSQQLNLSPLSDSQVEDDADSGAKIFVLPGIGRVRVAETCFFATLLSIMLFF